MDTMMIADTCLSQVGDVMPMHVVVETGGWEVASVVITLIFAIANLILAIGVFKLDQKSDRQKTIEDRRITMFKTLVLDTKISSFYGALSQMRRIVDKLPKLADNDVKGKAAINEELRKCFYELNTKFVDLLMAISYKSLYEPIRNQCQCLQDALTNAIFDEGIRLAHRPMFEERILTTMSTMQTEIIRVLYNYNGSVV